MPDLLLSSGLCLAFEHYGDESGEPVFYFHGWPSSRLQGELLDELGKRLGLHVVAMDRPGIGHSDFQPGRRLLDWPPVLLELARHLGWEKFHLFGVSGGGPYVLATAYAMPERVLSASVVCGAPPLKLLGTQDLFWPYRMILKLRQTLPWLLSPAFHLAAAISYLRPDQWPLRWIIATMDARDREVLGSVETQHIICTAFRECLHSGVPQVQADGDIYTSDWGFNLADISMPVHVWHGMADQNIPWSYAKQVAAMMPHAIPHWTAGDGHYSLAVLRAEEMIRVAICPPPTGWRGAA